MQPIFASDLAELAVQAGQQQENRALDTIGPETYTYFDLIRLIKKTIQSRAILIKFPAGLSCFFGTLVGMMANDTLITRDEIHGLMSGLLKTDSTPKGKTKFSEWLIQHAESLGRTYVSELTRHYL